MSGPRGSAERQSAQMCITRLEAEVERLQVENAELKAKVKRLKPYEQLADELVVALGDMCVHANEPCRCEERGQECVCGWAATRRSAEALIAKHTKLKGE